LRPAVAVETNVPLLPADFQTTQTPAQVFVHDNRAAVSADDAAGPHVAGLRTPRPDDDPSDPLYDAGGDPLYFTLEKWRAANGTLDIEPDTEGGTGDRVNLNLHRLIAFGHYSVFVRTEASDGPHFAPLDGSGITNNFDAHEDGAATVSISTAQHVVAGSWIVTIYHSDAQDHGNSPGEFAHTAHQQLLVKLP
jgi:hypothetical protein